MSLSLLSASHQRFLPYSVVSRLLYATTRFDVQAYGEILESHSLPRPLTHHQLITLELIRRGLTNGEIAQQLGTKPGTVAHTIKVLTIRLHVKDRKELIALADTVRTGE